MSTVITHDSDTITPTQVLGYQSEREARNIVHTILGNADPDVTLRPAGLRTGELVLGFHGDTAEADSKTAEDLHATGGVFNVVSSDRETIEMAYVVQGRVSRELDDESRDAWTLTVGYQEVTV